MFGKRLKIMKPIKKIVRQPQLNKDEKFRIEYVKLLIKSLNRCKNHDVNTIKFSEEENDVLMYHTKNVTVERVIGAIAAEECRAIFIGRIKRIIQKNRGEVTKVIDLIRRQRTILPTTNIEELRALLKHFAGTEIAV